MKSASEFADLIDTDELRAMLERLYESRHDPLALLTPEANIIAECYGHSASSRRGQNRYACLKSSLSFFPPETRSMVTRCSHRKFNLICPVVLNGSPLAFLVLYHITEPVLTECASDSTGASGIMAELEAYYAEFARMLAALAGSRRECHQAARALEEQNHLFDLVIGNIVDSVWLMDLNLNITFASRSACVKRGCTFEELRSTPLERHLTPASYRKACEMMVESLNSPEERASQYYQVDMEYYRKDGTTFWSETHLRFVRNAYGEVMGILGVGRDITDLKNAEQRINQLSLELRSHFPDSPAADKASGHEGDSIPFGTSLIQPGFQGR